MNSVGGRIKQVRINIGWTQARLAREARLSKSFISDLENGKTGASGDNLLKITQILGVSLDYLMKGNNVEKVVAPKTLEIPIELSKVAEELNIPFGEVLVTLEVQRSLTARRNSRQKQTMSEDDWKQLFENLKSFIR